MAIVSFFAGCIVTVIIVKRDERKKAEQACAMIAAMGMHAENEQRKHLGQSMAYVEKDFEKIADEFGIHHNNVIEYFRN